MLPLEGNAPTSDRARRPLLGFGSFTFDPGRRLLRRGDAEITLPPRVIGVLDMLLARAGDIVPRQELIDSVWKDAFVTDTSLAEAVSFLRQALGDDPQSPTYIQTVHRRGYRFVAPIEEKHWPLAPAAVPSAAEPSGVERVSPSIARDLVPWGLASLLFCIAAIAVWQATHPTATLTPPAQFAVGPAAGTRFDARAPAIAISRDGSTLAWSGCDAAGCRLYIRPLDRLDPAPVAGTDDAGAPFFSPDGRSIGFFADGRLKRLGLSGGAAATIADVPEPLGAVWLADGTIVFAGSIGSGLMRVPEQGGTATTLTVPRADQGEIRHAWPSLSADGRFVLFTIETIPGVAGAGRGGLLPTGPSAPQWSTFLAGIGVVRAGSPDTLLVSRGSDVQAVMFDRARAVLAGAPSTVLSRVAAARGASQLAVSATGTIAYAVEPDDPDDGDGLFWWTSAGVRPAPAAVRRLSGATLSPDGTRIARADGDGTRADIWVADVERGAATRLTHEAVNAAPVWSGDGRTIYFASRTSGPYAIWRRDADGASPATRVFSTDRHALPAAASPDGRLLAFLRIDDKTRADIWLLPADQSAPRALVQSPFDDCAPAFSPDSALLAYQSAEAGRWDVYIQRLRDGRRAVVSSDGGAHPFWSRDGRTLYFESGNRLMSVGVDNGDSLRVEAVSAVMDLNGATVAGVTPDGRFLLDRRAASRPAVAVVAIEWMREVRRLLGPPTAQMPR